MLLIAGIISNKMDTSKYLKNPNVADVYEIEKRNDEGKKVYTTYRVLEVKGDSVIFELNDYEVSSITKLDDLQRQHKNDYSEKQTISKSELENMLDKSLIKSIERKK